MNMSPMPLGFTHRFTPASKSGSGTTLLLLHGTGGDETDMLPLGHALAPDAAMLSPRGKVLENGMPRFFRRLAEGVFDLEDLRFRTHELADFVESAAAHYSFDLSSVIAVGFSNGANIAASMLLLRPRLLAGAVLFRPMVPLIPENLPNLSGIRIFIAAGRQDPIVSPAETHRLETLLRQAGAEVTLHWQLAGHTLTSEEIEIAQEWLSRRTFDKSFPRFGSR